MYKTLKIENFRCFEDFTLEHLERVNLIAGRNNVGKTALLEAIFMLAGPHNPDISLRINMFRGIEKFAGEPEEAWGWLFFNKRVDDPIRITTVDDKNVSRSLQISLPELTTTTITPQERANKESEKIDESFETKQGDRELILQYHDTTGLNAISRAFFTGEGQLKIERGMRKYSPSGVFFPTTHRFPAAVATRFSNLDREGRINEVLANIRILEPRLKRLTLLFQDGVAIVAGDIGLKELVPLPVMGEGLVRLLSILLAIADSPGGYVLVDEIENGFHHTVLTEVWKAIALAARKSDTQLLATTHSWECIEAAHKAFTDFKNYDFLLHRLDSVDAKIKAVTYDQKKLSTAMKTDLEVR
jgi:AAA15 family ATPase/GTPase